MQQHFDFLWRFHIYNFKHGNLMKISVFKIDFLPANDQNRLVISPWLFGLSHVYWSFFRTDRLSIRRQTEKEIKQWTHFSGFVFGYDYECGQNLDKLYSKCTVIASCWRPDFSSVGLAVRVYETKKQELILGLARSCQYVCCLQCCTTSY